MLNWFWGKGTALEKICTVKYINIWKLYPITAD